MFEEKVKIAEKLLYYNESFITYINYIHKKSGKSTFSGIIPHALMQPFLSPYQKGNDLKNNHYLILF